LDKLSTKEITKFVINVLLSYHMRETGRLNKIIIECGCNNNWHKLWPKFREASQDESEALLLFSQFIMAQLDGGDYELPEGLVL